MDYFLARTGEILTSQELRAVAGVSEWARRVRELRDEHGYQILTNADRSDLRPGQYILVSNVRNVPAGRAISKETRALVLETYGSVCYSCGAIAGEPHPANAKPTVLHMGHVVGKSHGGSDSLANLRPVCMVCNTGAANIMPELPTSKRLIALLRKAPRPEQVQVYKWLRSKFKDNDD